MWRGNEAERGQMIGSGETSQSCGISKYQELREHMARAWGPSLPSVFTRRSLVSVFVLNTVGGPPEGCVSKET